MKQNLFKFLIIGTIFISCAGNVNKNNIQAGKSEVKSIEADSVNLETFSVIPNEIDGCGCSFYLSENDKKDNKYICVNDFANLAFVKLKGEMVKLELTEHKDSSSIYLYKSKEYTLKIEVLKKEPSEYEASNIEGVITISSKEGIKKQKFVGTCGC
jgi:hypothetical protein